MQLHLAPAPTPVTLAVAADDELDATAHQLITRYVGLLNLGDWRVDLQWSPAEAVVGRTLYSQDKREAILFLRTEMMRRDNGRYLAYTIAHELAHLVLADLQVIRDRLTDALPKRVVDMVHENWKWVDETAVHKIALLLPGVERPEPEFWWKAFDDGNPE